MKYLLIILSGFELFDGIITHFLVRSGLAQEGNPLMESLVTEGNFLWLKVISIPLCVLVLWRLHQRFHKLTMTATSAIAMFYIAVVTWNLGVFFTVQY